MLPVPVECPASGCNTNCNTAVELQPWRPIFEKCPHLREKGGVLTKIWNIRNRLSRTVPTYVYVAKF